MTFPRPSHLLLTACAAALAGCGGGGTSTPAAQPAAASLSASTLTFAAQPAGTVSADQSVTLSNTGGSSLTIASVTLTGASAAAFTETTNCGATLPPNSSCTFALTFAPTAAGPATAALTLADNAAGSPQSVALSGTGTAPAVSLSAAALTFPSLAVGTTSAGQTITLSNTGTAPLTIASIAFTGAAASSFTQGNTCGATLAAGASCAITVAFVPAATGAATASLAIADNAAASPQTVALSGTGTSVLSLTKVSATEWDVTNGILSFQFTRQASPSPISRSRSTASPPTGSTRRPGPPPSDTPSASTTFTASSEAPIERPHLRQLLHQRQLHRHVGHQREPRSHRPAGGREPLRHSRRGHRCALLSGPSPSCGRCSGILWRGHGELLCLLECGHAQRWLDALLCPRHRPEQPRRHQ